MHRWAKLAKSNPSPPPRVSMLARTGWSKCPAACLPSALHSTAHTLTQAYLNCSAGGAFACAHLLQQLHRDLLRGGAVQSLTKKPVKGMLTGPVTILNWSFPRKDISRRAQAVQLGLALRDEVSDLEKAGCRVIQVLLPTWAPAAWVQLCTVWACCHPHVWTEPGSHCRRSLRHAACWWMQHEE